LSKHFYRQQFNAMVVGCCLFQTLKKRHSGQKLTHYELLKWMLKVPSTIFSEILADVVYCSYCECKRRSAQNPKLYGQTKIRAVTKIVFTQFKHSPNTGEPPFMYRCDTDCWTSGGAANFLFLCYTRDFTHR